MLLLLPLAPESFRVLARGVRRGRLANSEFNPCIYPSIYIYIYNISIFIYNKWRPDGESPMHEQKMGYLRLPASESSRAGRLLPRATSTAINELPALGPRRRATDRAPPRRRTTGSAEPHLRWGRLGLRGGRLPRSADRAGTPRSCALAPQLPPPFLLHRWRGKKILGLCAGRGN